MQQHIQQLVAPLGITELTEIQKEVLEQYVNYDEIVLYAPTGTGKTLAFLLPLVEQLRQENQASVTRALILSPTRELATQIERVFKSLKTEFSITACYGGHSLNVETNNLLAQPTVVVATPGRLVDHLERQNLSLSEVRYFVVDEFDKCLEMGFHEEIAHIYGETRDLKKLFFGSATKLENFPVFIKLVNPIYIDKTQQDQQPDIDFFSVKTLGDKLKTVQLLATQFQNERCIIFCNFRENVDQIASFFREHKMVVAAYHGGLDQDDRERALIKFINNSAPILVCTDIGSRGLDIPEVMHIVHFQLPDKMDAFIHRNGRTARMTQNGNAYLFQEDHAKAKFDLPKMQPFTIDTTATYTAPNWATLYFSAGKKNKVSKIDLLGFLCQKGELEKSEVGVIVVRDFTSYASVKTNNANKLLAKLREHKVKGKKLKMEVAW
jgi:superfamily II DNA/RNA helicase